MCHGPGYAGNMLSKRALPAGRGLLGGGTTGQRALSKRRWSGQVVMMREQLELRPSVALQKKVGLKSLEQVIRWGDRVNQELRRWRKLEDKKCWRARARCIGRDLSNRGPQS